MKTKIKNIKGFSLIEVLLYVSLLSLSVIALVAFMQKMLEINTKQKLVSQLNFESERSLDLLSLYIRNAKSVNLPSKGDTSNTLSLEVFDFGKSPTVIKIINGKLSIKEGLTEAVVLNSDNINTTDLIFTNLGKTNSRDSIKINFKTISQSNSTRSEYNYEKNYEITASLRN